MALAGTTAENQSLNGLDASGSPTNLMAYTALNTGSPGTTGANENPATGGYARQATTWNAASSGSKTNSAGLTFSTAGTTAVTYLSELSAVTSGTYGIGAQLASSVTAASISVASGAIAYSSS